SLDPMFQIAREPLAELYLRANRAAEAEKLLRDGVAQAPEQGEPYFVLGKLLGSDPQRLADAVAMFAEAAKKSPTTARYQYNLGVALEQLGQWAPAADALAVATKLDPQATDAWHALAIAQRQLERWPDLRITAGELLSRSPDEPTYQHLHGLALLRLGDATAAEHDLLGASRAAEQSPDVAITLAEFFEVKQDWERAVGYARLALSLSPTDREIQKIAVRIQQAAAKASVGPSPAAGPTPGAGALPLGVPGDPASIGPSPGPGDPVPPMNPAGGTPRVQ
ncbi:MAG TPA: tetratricopeptide repeat protein, partial [Pirellulales bacterium]